MSGGAAACRECADAVGAPRGVAVATHPFERNHHSVDLASAVADRVPQRAAIDGMGCVPVWLGDGRRLQRLSAAALRTAVTAELRGLSAAPSVVEVATAVGQTNFAQDQRRPAASTDMVGLGHQTGAASGPVVGAITPWATGRCPRAPSLSCR
jgi:hypothetical protein